MSSLSSFDLVDQLKAQSLANSSDALLNSSPAHENDSNAASSDSTNAEPGSSASASAPAAKPASKAPASNPKKKFSLPKSLPKLAAPSATAASAKTLWTGDSSVSSITPSASTSASRGLKAASSQSRVSLTLPNVDDVACRKTIAEVRRSTKASLETSRSSTGSTTFIITGPQTEVDSARAIVQRNHAPHVSMKLEVPSSTRSLIIGPRGQNLFKITDSTYTKINVGQVEENGEWSLPTVVVDINGTVEAVAKAAEMIRAKISSRGTDVTASRIIPKRLVPFLERFVGAGPVPATHTVKVYKDTGALTVSGPIDGSAAVRQLVDAEVARLGSKCVSQQISESLQRLTSALPSDSLFAQHGVVIDGQSLFGPAESLSVAAAALEKRLQVLAVDALDISRAHGKNVEHSKHLARYFEQYHVLQEIGNKSGVTFTLKMSPESENVVYTISGEDVAAVKACRRSLVRLVSSLPFSTVLTLPALRTSLAKSKLDQLVSSAVAASESLKLVKADKLGSDEFVIDALVAETQDDDFGATEPAFSAELASLAGALVPLTELDNNTTVREVQVPVVDHRHVREPFGSAKGKLSAFIKGEDDTPKVLIHYGPGALITLEGSDADVNALAESLYELIEDSKDYQQRASYTETCQVDPKSVSMIIGRQGASIQEVMDKFHVQIDTERQSQKSSGQLSVRGLEANVHKAIKHLQEMDARIQDYISLEISAPQQYHSMIIGPKGRSAKRFREQQGVHLKFPDASEKSDVIVLRGGSKEVAAVAKEIKEFIDYEKAHSQEKTISIPAKAVRALTGRQGTAVNAISHDTGAKINIGRPENDKVEVNVVGTAKEVKSACDQIERLVAAATDREEKEIVVEPRLLRFIRGAEIRDQLYAAVGADSTPGSGHVLAIPPMQSSSNIVKIIGPKKIAEGFEREINKIISSKIEAEKFSAEVAVPGSSVGGLIGTGGSNKRQIESEFGVTLAIPSAKAGKNENVKITVRGPNEAAVENAKARIEQITRVSRAEIKIPAKFVALAASHGTFVRSLEDKYKVRVQVQGSRSEQLPALTVPEIDNSKLESAGSYFTTIPLELNASGMDATWVITGKNDEQVAEAAKAANERLAKVQLFDTAGFLWFNTPKMYASVIGVAGMTVNTIRQASGCYIDVPKKTGSTNSPVIIRGTKPDVEKAVKLLLQEARNAE